MKGLNRFSAAYKASGSPELFQDNLLALLFYRTFSENPCSTSFLADDQKFEHFQADFLSEIPIQHHLLKKITSIEKKIMQVTTWKKLKTPLFNYHVMPESEFIILFGLISSMNPVRGYQELADIYGEIAAALRYGSDAVTNTEYYVPSSVSRLIANLISTNHAKADLVADIAASSASLCIEAAVACFSDRIHLICRSPLSLRLSMMQLLLSGRWESADLDIRDTLADRDLSPYQIQVLCPPFSAAWTPHSCGDKYPVLVPPNKADFAYVLQAMSHLGEEAFLILPAAALHRRGAENKIRQELIRHNLVDVIILLPGGIFPGTPVHTCIIVFKTNKPSRDVLYIDARNRKAKDSGRTVLTGIQEIANTYAERKGPLSQTVPVEELLSGDLRFVDRLNPKPSFDIMSAEIDQQIQQKKEEIRKLHDDIIQNMSVEVKMKCDLTNAALPF